MAFEIGLNRDFQYLDWDDWELMKLAHLKKECKELERLRLLTYWIVKGNFDIKDSIENFMPLPTDKRKVVPIITDLKYWESLFDKANPQLLKNN